jgi:hypothetical protein
MIDASGMQLVLNPSYHCTQTPYSEDANRWVPRAQRIVLKTSVYLEHINIGLIRSR